jgi:predicted transcriptional regulator of viral defense system
MDNPRILITAEAEKHHGIVAAHHFTDLGITERQRLVLIESGVIRRARYGAYRVAGVPTSWRGELLAAVWAGGNRALGSHRSALAVRHLPGSVEAAQEVLCPRWQRARHASLIVHESRVLDDVDRSVVDGIPVTSVERTIVDLGAVSPRTLVERALEAALRDELTTLDKVQATFDRLARRGRRGVAILRSILDEYDADRRLTETDRETMMLQVFRKHGLPDPVPQYVVRHNGRFIARVDAALPQFPIAFEYESYQWHTGKSALVRDNRRRNALLAVGWPTIGVTAADLRSGGELLCSQIFDMIRRAS